MLSSVLASMFSSRSFQLSFFAYASYFVQSRSIDFSCWSGFFSTFPSVLPHLQPSVDRWASSYLSELLVQSFFLSLLLPTILIVRALTAAFSSTYLDCRLAPRRLSTLAVVYPTATTVFTTSERVQLCLWRTAITQQRRGKNAATHVTSAV